MKCSICDCNYYEVFKYLNCESFDDTPIYKYIRVVKCNQCGHIYNELTEDEIRGLEKYYKEEYALLDLQALDKCGFRPGSSNPFSLERYEESFDLVSPYINEDSRILDVGCAKGGFLKFLKGKGFKNLYGIDVVKQYVDLADDENIRTGSAYNISFEDNFFDLVILDHTLEHLIDLKSAMKEIRRVLNKGGLCYIGVPDASKYDDLVYWFTMKEHVQHFDLERLKLLAENNDFILIDSKKTRIPMTSEKNLLPNLSVLLKVSYNVYCWGIGREFMYYYPNTRLNRLDLILVDDTPEKQKKIFKGMKIHSSNVLKTASKDSFLIIIPTLHKEVMKEKAMDLGYKGIIIDV